MNIFLLFLKGSFKVGRPKMKIKSLYMKFCTKCYEVDKIILKK